MIELYLKVKKFWHDSKYYIMTIGLVVLAIVFLVVFRDNGKFFIQKQKEIDDSYKKEIQEIHQSYEREQKKKEDIQKIFQEKEETIKENQKTETKELDQRVHDYVSDETKRISEVPEKEAEVFAKEFGITVDK